MAPVCACAAHQRGHRNFATPALGRFVAGARRAQHTACVKTPRAPETHLCLTNVAGDDGRAQKRVESSPPPSSATDGRAQQRCARREARPQVVAVRRSRLVPAHSQDPALMRARWHPADLTIRSTLAMRRSVADTLSLTRYFPPRPFLAHCDLAAVRQRKRLRRIGASSALQRALWLCARINLYCSRCALSKCIGVSGAAA